MSRISYSKHHPAALRPQLPQHPAHGDVGNRSAVPIRHELEFSEKLLEECPAAPPDEGGNQYAIRDAIRDAISEKLLEECPAAPPDEGGNQYAIRDAISMPSLCHQYAISTPSVRLTGRGSPCTCASRRSTAAGAAPQAHSNGRRASLQRLCRSRQASDDAPLQRRACHSPAAGR